MYFRKMKLLKLILSPIAILYLAITSIRNSLFNLRILKQYKSSIPVISVGNLNLGGTGKTPHVAYILELLHTKNRAVISRGYKRETKQLIEGDSTVHTVKDLGDEPRELLQKFEGSKFKMIVESNRAKALQYLEQHKDKTDIVVLDDGFQHRYAKRNLNILLTDYNKPFFTDYIVPIGTLRESRFGAKRADIVIVTKCPQKLNQLDKETIQSRVAKYSSAEVYFSQISYTHTMNYKGDIEELKSEKSYLVITGIANPKPLHEHLTKLGLKFEPLQYSDHHNFKDSELELISTKSKEFDGIITTEKDWMRLCESKLHPSAKAKTLRLCIGINFVDSTQTNKFKKRISNTL